MAAPAPLGLTVLLHNHKSTALQNTRNSTKNAPTRGCKPSTCRYVALYMPSRLLQSSKLYSEATAPWPCTLRVTDRIVTHSSAAVGCMPTVASNCALVAPHLRAMASPCMISAASGPTLQERTKTRGNQIGMMPAALTPDQL
jgi:hypothetical protein